MATSSQTGADLPLLLGVDLGTGSIRAAIFDRRGRTVSRAGRPTPVDRPRQDWAEFRPEALWRVLTEVIAEAVAACPQSSSIVAMAVASVGESMFPVGEDGRELAPAIAWFDGRTREQLARLEGAIGRERLFSITGLTPDMSLSACKLLWMRDHDPARFERAVTWLCVADWVAWRLTGRMATDPSLASRTLLFDIARRDWSDELLAAVGLDRTRLPAVRPNGHALGPVKPDLADRLGLPRGTIVAVGGHDHVVGGLAAGAFEADSLLDSLGTAEALVLMRDAPALDGALATRGYAQGSIDPGTSRIYVLGGLHTAGAAIEWARTSLLGGIDHAGFVELARNAPAGSRGLLFVPHLHSSTMPQPDPDARGAFLGLSGSTRRAEIARAVHEGLAFEARAVLEGMRDGADAAKGLRISAIGGGVRNALLMRVKASVYGRPVRAAVLEDATALGAAILAGLGAGAYSDIEEAAATVEITWREVEPETEWQATYERLYEEVYRKAYDSLRPLNHALRQLGPS